MLSENKTPIKIDHIKKSLLIAFLIVVLYKIIDMALGPISSIDLFWHLRLGLDFLEQVRFPFIDYYSVPNEGNPYNWPTPWLFQVVVASFYKINSQLETLKVFKILVVLMPLILSLYLFLKRELNYLGLGGF